MNNIIKRVWNQNRMVQIEDLSGMTFQAESGGHTFEIFGVDDTGATVNLSGTVTGVFRRPDNADIALTGSASGGVASVTLTDDCYAVPGRFGLTIFVTSGGQKTAVYAAIGTVASTNGGAVAGDTPQDVVDLINAIEAAVATIPADYTDLMAAIAPMYSNSALYAVGSYAWYDGDLYRCTTPITTAETWTAAHWTAAVIGNDVARIGENLKNLDDSVFNVPYTPSNMSTDSNGKIWLEKGYISAKTGASGADNSGSYYKTQVGNGNTEPFLLIGDKPLMISVDLDWVEYTCWSYSGVTNASATHSNTNKGYFSGLDKLYIPATSPDVRFAIAFRTLGANDAQRPAFTPEQLNTLKDAIKIRVATDSSLSIVGAAADANAVTAALVGSKNRTNNIPSQMTWWEVPNTFDANNPIYPADVPYNSFTYQTGALLAGFADKGVPIDTSGSKAYWVFRFRSFHNTNLTSYLIYNAYSGQLFCAQSSNGGSTLTVSNFGGGKTASVLWLGDSISRGRLGGQSANASIPIPNRVAIETGLDVQNFGIGNIGFCAGWTSDTPNKTNAIGYLKRVGDPNYYDPSDNWAGYKFLGTGDWSRFNTIVIALGTNDNNYPLGSLSDIDDTLSYATVMAWKTSAQDSDASNRTIVKALYQCYRYIRESEDYHTGSDPYVPNGKYMNIILSDPIISGDLETGTAPSWGYNTTRGGGFTRIQMNELYEAFAQKYGCGHISNYDAPIDRMHLANSLPDGVHPNETTYQQLGRHFAGKVAAVVL